MPRRSPLTACAFALILTTIAVSRTFAQETPTPHGRQPGRHPAAELPTGVIRGTVFCGDTHRPARNAVVMLSALGTGESGTRDNMVMTNLDGSYTLEHVPPGDFVVLAMAAGYLAPFDGVTVSDNPREASKLESEINKGLVAQYGSITMAPHGSLTHDVTMQRGAAVSGRVLYADGSPASGIRLRVENTAETTKRANPETQQLNLGAMMRRMFLQQSDHTDDLGRFRIAGLAPGTYRVAALQETQNGSRDMQQRMSMAIMGMGSDQGMLAVYSGDTAHRAQAKTYDLRPGDEISEITINIPTEFHSVSGTVSAHDGRMLNMGKLTLTDTADDTVVFKGELQRDGTFRFSTLLPGTYTFALKAGRIGKQGPVPHGMEGMNAELLQNLPLDPANAFADTSTSVEVKNSDVADLNLTTSEIPLPPAPKPDQSADSNSEDNDPE